MVRDHKRDTHSTLTKQSELAFRALLIDGGTWSVFLRGEARLWTHGPQKRDTR